MPKRPSSSADDVQAERNYLPTITAGASDERMKAAAQRAISAHRELRKKADSLSLELDDVTPVHGVPTAGLSEEDSAVHAVALAIEAAKAST